MRHLLELDAGRPERPHAGVLVDRCRPGLDDRRGRQRAARDVPEVAPAGAAGETARRARLEVGEDRVDRHAVLRQRLVEARRELGPVDRHARLRGRVERRAEALCEILDCRVELPVGHRAPSVAALLADSGRRRQTRRPWRST